MRGPIPVRRLIQLRGLTQMRGPILRRRPVGQRVHGRRSVDGPSNRDERSPDESPDDRLAGGEEEGEGARNPAGDGGVETGAGGTELGGTGRAVATTGCR